MVSIPMTLPNDSWINGSYVLNNETALLRVLGILLAHAVSAALKTRPKFKIATTSTTTTTTTTEEPHVEENDHANSEVREKECYV